MKERTCSRCGFQGYSDLFRKGRNVCLECQHSYTKKWYKTNWDSVKLTEKRRRVKKYGITVDDYDNLIIEQGNKCKICSNSFVDSLPVIDHCHGTGLVRGLLCHSCNIGIGHLKENPEIMRKAIDYVSNENKPTCNYTIKGS